MSFPLRTIDFPKSALRVSESTFHLSTEGEYSTGAFSPTPRSTGPRHQRWRTDVSTTALSDIDGEDQRMTWEATIASLQGTFIAMKLYHPARILPRGKGAGLYRIGHQHYHGDGYLIDGQYRIDGEYEIVDGSPYAYVAEDAARYDDTIVMTSLVPSELVFRRGDHFGLGGNLYMIMDDATSDENGEVRVRFLWKLWKPALTGDRIDLFQPTARFVLTSQDGGTMTHVPLFGTASFSAIEVPYVE